jgi:methionyl-tRNA formyltransferase
MTAGAAPQRAAEPARTIFFGSGSFAVPILDALVRLPTVRVVGVVTAPDRPAGRSRTLTATPVSGRASALGLPILRPGRVRAPEALAEIAALRPDLGVLADFGQIVPAALLALPPHGILNAHPSLLPRHRGATPIPAAIADGDAETGVTIFRMDEGIDTGPIVASRAWLLTGTERAPDLEATAARQGAQLLSETIERWLAGAIPARPQPADGATTTRPFRREDGRLDPTRPARELERRVRAHLPWPGSFIDTQLGRVSVLATSVAAARPGDEPGRFVEDEGRLALTSSDGRLVFEEAQREGRRAVGGPEFLRGQRQLVDTGILSAR